MKCRIFIISLLVSAFCADAAKANWEYYQQYHDDGSRVTMTLRGGLSHGRANIKNDFGYMTESYWVENIYIDDGSGGLEFWDWGTVPFTGRAIDLCVQDPACDITFSNWGDYYTHAGDVNIGDLPAAKKYSEFSWAGGVSIGFTIPQSPQWRLEGDWLRISETTYEAFPLFMGDVLFDTPFILGDYLYENPVGLAVIGSGGAHSTVTTDVFSAMFYYDFFQGNVKPIGQMIPYIGFGVGYASSATVLEMTDLFGDLTSQAAMLPFSPDVPKDVPVLEFYTSTYVSRNVAGNAALGFSYGLMQGMYLDLGLRFTYIPRIQWKLNNELGYDAAGEKQRSIFSAQNVIYTSALLGLRFEF
ncbi:MAG: hypothetical protein FWG80_04215 [Alphaproteobacteria bacterium]|nr:hypothetical protein [Alphaproteobacteria bacterium]